MKFSQKFQPEQFASKFENYLKASGKEAVKEKQDDGYIVSFADDMSIEDKEKSVTLDNVKEVVYESMNEMYSIMVNMQNYVWAEIEWLEQKVFEHIQNGHIPPIQGAEKLQNALNVLGIGEDYNVQKPTVWAKNGDIVIDGMKLNK